MTIFYLEKFLAIVFLSVIVPVYLKPQQFLRECIESILVQTLSDFELILINDASPDQSLDTLEYYAKKDFRIKVINLKHNQGVAVARNIGLYVAQGKYVTFVDSDDMIAPDYFETLVKVAEYFNLDIVAASVTNFQKTHQIKSTKPLNFRKVLQPNEIPFRIPMVQHFVCRIFLRSTISNLYFDKQLHRGEDTLFIHQAMMISKKCVDINYKGYYYRHWSDDELKADQIQFYSMEQKEDAKLLQHIEETLYLTEQLCNLKQFAKKRSDFQFIRYLSVRRFLRHSNSVWKLIAYEKQVFYWQKFCNIFIKQIQPQLLHCFLSTFLCWIFKYNKPFYGVRTSIYFARVLCEIYHIKQNVRRFFKPIKLYFKGIAC